VLTGIAAVGTWGTYIELSAFVNRFRRAIKVVQPGLVYVFPPDDDINATKGASEHGEEDVEDMEESEGGGTDAKGKRTLRSEKHEEVVVVLALPEEEDPTPLYIAYVVHLVVPGLALTMDTCRQIP
jgi:hypothetical protein